MTQRIFGLTFWAALAFTFVMAALPQPPELAWATNDKALHMLAFSALTILALAAFPEMPRWKLAGALLAFGAAIELVQTVPALNRQGDMLDWAADAAAVLTVMAVAGALRLGRSEPDDPENGSARGT